nr:N-terminal phage integrase SAM-like domain-containing protein [uncultured Oscillibacter sp.]
MTRDWEYAEPRLRENTKDYYLNYISNHIIPELGDIKLDKLTTIQIQKVYNDLQKNGRVQRYQHIQLKNKGLSVRVVHGIHTLLNSCLEQAVDLLVKEYKKHPGNPYMFP